MSVVYDAAVLVAADGNVRRTWAEHKARLELGIVPLVPAPVIAQVSRSPEQAQLRRFLTGCAVVSFGENEAHEAGRLLGKTRTGDVIDAVVVTTAIRHDAMIFTSDPRARPQFRSIRPTKKAPCRPGTEQRWHRGLDVPVCVRPHFRCKSNVRSPGCGNSVVVRGKPLIAQEICEVG